MALQNNLQSQDSSYRAYNIYVNNVGRLLRHLLLLSTLLLAIGCKVSEDFSNSEIQGVEDRKPITFIPFSTNSFYVDGSQNTDSSISARALMGGPAVAAYSFSLWFKMDSSDDQITGVFVSSDFDIEYNISLAWQPGTNNLVYYNLYANGGPVNSTTISIPVPNPRKWNHVIITYIHDGVSFPTRNTNKMYLNGELVGSETGDGQEFFWLAPRRIDILPSGKKLSPSYLDEFSFWRKELSQTEVTSIYNAGVPGNLAVINNDYISWWRFGEKDSLPTIADETDRFPFDFNSAIPTITTNTPTPPPADPFAGEGQDDPLNENENGDGTSGGSGSDPFTGGSGGFGGELGDGSGGQGFP